MAILHRLISVAGETAGFLLPVFHTVHGANQELVQQIDQHDQIVSLDPVRINEASSERVQRDVEVHVGDRAFWAFRDQSGTVHMGTATDIQSAGRRLLSSGLLARCPMAAAELATFCKAELDYPETLTSAFQALRRLSKRGAETWRDTVILLPLIKQDIESQTLRRGRDRVNLHGVFAITRHDVTEIYVPASIASSIAKLPRWRAIADIFGIRDFHVHPIKARSEKHEEQPPIWSILGMGGVARFVIQRPPFSGSINSSIAPLGGAIAYGPPIQGRTYELQQNRLIYSTCIEQR